MNAKKIFKFCLETLACLIVILLLYHCPLSYFFGLSCPGCGMTRAAISLIQFRFAEAWYYHPLVYVMPVLVIYLILRHFKLWRLPDRTHRRIIVSTALLFIVVFLIRLFTKHPVVAWDYHRGLVYKIFQIILQIFIGLLRA